MADRQVHAIRHQRVVLAELEADRSVQAEIDMGVPEHPERGQHHAETDPWNERREPVVGEFEQRCEQVEELS